MIHLEGMGWLGSALALRLDRAGVEFTWHDTDDPYCAWKASTGMVYPSGDARSERNRALWAAWCRDGAMPPGTVEAVRYVFTHRKPPHEGAYRYADLGWARVAHPLGYAVNAPAIVAVARERFAGCRTDGPTRNQKVIRAHGFNSRRQAYMWGWSAPVKLALPTSLADLPHRVALYSRAHRFQIVYAYVIPSRPGWYWAGSSLVRQAQPRELDAERHRDDWLKAFERLWTTVAVEDVEAPVHGWRPVPAPGDSPVYRAGEMPPMWHSGVRWAPMIIDRIVQQEAVTR